MGPERKKYELKKKSVDQLGKRKEDRSFKTYFVVYQEWAFSEIADFLNLISVLHRNTSARADSNRKKFQFININVFFLLEPILTRSALSYSFTTTICAAGRRPDDVNFHKGHSRANV